MHIMNSKKLRNFLNITTYLLLFSLLPMVSCKTGGEIEQIESTHIPHNIVNVNPKKSLDKINPDENTFYHYKRSENNKKDETLAYKRPDIIAYKKTYNESIFYIIKNYSDSEKSVNIQLDFNKMRAYDNKENVINTDNLNILSKIIINKHNLLLLPSESILILTENM